MSKFHLNLRYSIVCLTIFLLSIATISPIEAAPNIERGFFLKSKDSTPAPRDYWSGPTKYEDKTIRWIVTTLATATWKSIIVNASELNKKGDTLSNMHPYNFMLVIFRDEELKCHARAIKINGGMIKNNFYDGICRSLKQESACNNLKSEYLNHFCKKIKINPAALSPLIEQQLWEKCVDYIIENVPRETDPKRYIM